MIEESPDKRRGHRTDNRRGTEVSAIRWSEDTDLVRLGLPADLDLPMAQTLVDSLRHAFASARAIRIDAEAVERISTACVQALVAASNQSAENGVTFAIVQPSVVVVEACEDLGLSAWLKQWSGS